MKSIRSVTGLDGWSLRKLACLVLMVLAFGFFPTFLAESFARSAAMPWATEPSFQSLVYGSSSAYDVTRVMGAQPDEIVRSQQMYPVVENFYYYDENKSGAATVFVFEAGFLVGMHLKTPDNQLVDMTYFLTNNGDRQLMNPILGQYLPYYFNPRFTTVAW